MIKVKLITMLMIFSVSIYAQDFDHPGEINFDFVPQLCHTEVMLNFIKVQSDLNLETLTLFDKSQFVPPAKTESIKKDYFDGSESHAHEKLLQSHENIFPKWYTPAHKVVLNQEGMTSYYDNSQGLETKGWQRGVPKSNETLTYKFDEESQLLSSFSQQTEKSKRDYDINQQIYLERGFLSKYVFNIPSELELEDMEYEIKGPILKVTVEEDTHEWNVKKMLYTYQQIDRGMLINTTTTTYKFNEEFKTHLIHSTTTVNPFKLENGDCYEKISKTVYSNFNTNCSNNITLDHRSRKKEAVAKLNLYPNPSSSIITVEIPNQTYASNVKLYSMSGQLLMARKVQAGQSKIDLAINNLSNGIYLIKVLQDSTTYSNKFTKI